MTRTEFVADLRVVLGALVDILDKQRDRRAGRDLRRHAFILEDAGQDLHRVRFLALGDEFRLSRTAAIQVALDVSLGECNAGWTAIDHAADRRPMALAKGRDPKQMAETVVRHA